MRQSRVIIKIKYNRAGEPFLSVRVPNWKKWLTTESYASLTNARRSARRLRMCDWTNAEIIEDPKP